MSNTALDGRTRTASPRSVGISLEPSGRHPRQGRRRCRPLGGAGGRVVSGRPTLA
jgi:hypothetical protein